MKGDIRAVNGGAPGKGGIFGGAKGRGGEGNGMYGG